MLLMALYGCAEESGITTVSVEDDMATDAARDMPQTPRDQGPMDQGQVEKDLGGEEPDLARDMMEDLDGMSGEGDMGADLVDMPPPPEVSYLLCALGQRAPWGECLEENKLEFGRVPPSQRVERLARIDNDGDLPITVTGAAFSQAEYAVTWRTYDRAQPPVEMEQTLPYTIEPGESLFAVVSLFGGLTMATLPATQLEISVDTGEMAGEEILTLELSARYDGCAVGMASCDMDVVNGCETNITTDVLHCGGCDMPCALDNATAQCAGANCLVASCEAGYGNCDMMQGNGCETNTDTSLDHCGGCNMPCSYDQANTACQSGSCVFEGCVGSWADCDSDLPTNGCESNTSNDLQHCGGCGMVCDYANALESCMNSACLFQGCEANYYNLDNDLTNGCEYFCQKQGNSDLPDTQYTDANCDGIDGDVQQAVFVSMTGSDTNSGGMSDPFRTLGKALNVAATTSGITQVLVASGNYEEQVFLVNGVHIAGGYQPSLGWQRSNTEISRTHWRQAMSKRVIAMSGSNITTDTLIHQMRVEAEDSSAAETSTYGLHCSSCTALRIEQSTFVAGDAGNGTAGMSGANGPTNSSTSGRGGNGLPGSCNSNPNNAGGAGGSSVCGRHGGRGGEGGNEGRNNGFSGLTGVFGTPGGTGGSGGDPGRRGNNGANGASGASGSNGGGGSGGSLVNGYWVGSDGNDGSNGSPGNGGGGGGGGGGQGCTFCNNGAGNGGGGGGAGGCAGTRGTGGNAGGSSFALFLYQSTGITLSNNSFQAGNGGAGGAGGAGGSGSSGIAGGLGGTTCTEDVGAGGNGGAGGDGGDGGDGGGGAGGNSYAIWREQTSTGLPGSNILTYGLPGQGGASQGNAGSVGQAGTYR